MRTRKRGTVARRAACAVALASGGALILGGTWPAAAGTAAIASCPSTVTAAGTYVLVADLKCPSSDGIVVQADNVHLVLKNHTLGGQRQGQDAPDFSGVHADDVSA